MYHTFHTVPQFTHNLPLTPPTLDIPRFTTKERYMALSTEYELGSKIPVHEGGIGAQNSLTVRPRRKAGQLQDQALNEPVVLTYNILQALFSKPLHVAAESLGLSKTAFKKVCRTFGVRNWPYRFQRLMQQKADEDRIQALSSKIEMCEDEFKEVVWEPVVTFKTDEHEQLQKQEEQEKEEQEHDEQEEHADGQAQEERGWEGADGAGNSAEEAEELRVLLEQSRSVWGTGRGGSELDLSFETAQGWLVSPVDAHTLPVWGPDHV